MNTSHLNLPYIASAQAQKHITHNEALRMLDALVQIGVVSDTYTAPPETPEDGMRFIIPASATDAWEGHETHLTMWQDGAWAFYPPQTGWQAWVSDQNHLRVWNGTYWVATHDLQNISVLGVHSSADETNRLSVSSPAALFNHDGAGHQLKINKSTASDSASVLYQTNYSGRGEIGLTGDDDFHLRVSADGNTFRTAQTWLGGSGLTQFPSVSRQELPIATSVGNGTLAYVSAGLTSPEFVFSDGFEWRKLSTMETVDPTVAYSTLDSNAAAPDVILSHNNQDLQVSSATWASARGTLDHNSGHYYFEALLVTLSNGSNTLIGVSDAQTTAQNLGTHPGGMTNSLAVRNDKMFSTGITEVNATPVYAPVQDDVMMVAVDFESGSIWFGRNGNWFTATPSDTITTGRNGQFTPHTALFPVLGCAGTANKVRLVTDADLLTHAPPVGFSAWG